MTDKRTASVLTIAGFDPSGGAGIAADIKTFAALGVEGFSVISCLTAQTESEVLATQKVEPDFIDFQFAALSKKRTDATKTGMLFDEETVISVCRNIRDLSIENVVADPVIESSSGARLLTDGGVEALKKELLPLCAFATPNIYEAQALCGVEIAGIKDMETAARLIARLGVKKVVVTGGHLPELEKVSDLLFDGENCFGITRPRVNGGEAHGTGCVFSSALCAFTARGKTGFEAVSAAGDFTADTLMKRNFSSGQGK